MIQSQSTSNPAAVSQWAAVEALNGPQDFIAKHNKIFKERRDLVVVDADQARASSARCRRAPLCLSVLRGTIGKTTPGGKKLASDEDFVTDCGSRRRRGSAGTAFGLGRRPAFPMRPKTEDLEEAAWRIQRFCGI